MTLRHRLYLIRLLSTAALIGGVLAVTAGNVGIGFAVIIASSAVGVLSAIALGNATSDRPNHVPTLDEVSTPTKARLRPIVKLRQEIVGLGVSHKENPVIAAMSEEMSETVDAVVMRSVQILDAKRKIQKMAAPVIRARAAEADLEAKLASEGDGETKASIQAALASRRAEVKTLEEFELTDKRLEANLNEAESTLAELRSQILKAAAEMSDHVAEEEVQPFSELADRLRRVSATMQESVETVSGNWA